MTDNSYCNQSIHCTVTNCKNHNVKHCHYNCSYTTGNHKQNRILQLLNKRLWFKVCNYHYEVLQNGNQQHQVIQLLDKDEIMQDILQINLRKDDLMLVSKSQ